MSFLVISAARHAGGQHVHHGASAAPGRGPVDVLWAVLNRGFCEITKGRRSDFTRNDNVSRLMHNLIQKIRGSPACCSRAMLRRTRGQKRRLIRTPVPIAVLQICLGLIPWAHLPPSVISSRAVSTATKQDWPSTRLIFKCPKCGHLRASQESISICWKILQNFLPNMLFATFWGARSTSPRCLPWSFCYI